MLFVGSLHGNERNSGLLLDAWLNEVEANVDNIPAGKSVVIIPRLNADGYAVNTRTNSNGIDLNRNFPTANWKTNVTQPGVALSPAGGPSPLSEPESQALAQYVRSIRPRLTIDYHSHAGLVQSNGAADSGELATKYAKKSGYWLLAPDATGSAFDYDTTGSFEDWTKEALGVSEFIVELTSSSSTEFSQNRAAMWDSVRS